MALFPASIQRALAIPPPRANGTLNDVQHVVILMQENRSFDHYFGTMSGVRGFGDRSLVPQPSGETVWSQSDGTRRILPFHLDTQKTNALRVPSTPHSWNDAHQAWDEGRLHEWPRYKQFESMGYYEADDIPFQRALADAFTLCDAHHCSVQSGTLANRTVFMTGTNCAPGRSTPAKTQTDALIDNFNNRGDELGCYHWTTYPERLQAAGVSWRIYQDPADNWDGLLAPWEAFQTYRDATPGDPLHEGAMRGWTLEHLAQHVAEGSLPSVSWIVPSPVWSEHPARSSPTQGAAFTQRVLDTLVSNPELWSRTVLFITFDENDGLFDHVPPPAPPSLDEAGQMLGGSTLSRENLAGLYFENEIAGVSAVRPYGMGPRVPLYAISPWSRGGWVCSQVFDHTSVIQFLEARFGVEEPNISAWHRAVSGDLTSCFDFARPDREPLPSLPDMSYAKGETLVLDDLPGLSLPARARMPGQDPGVRFSRALPYRASVHATPNLQAQTLELTLQNGGSAGLVLHVYDRLHLERRPHRFTIEAHRALSASWPTENDAGLYDLYVLGPNGALWTLTGQLPGNPRAIALPEVRLHARPAAQSVELEAYNLGGVECQLTVSPNSYRSDPARSLTLSPDTIRQVVSWPVSASGFWYDFTVQSPALSGWSRRFAGRLETGRHGVSDPALGGAGRC